MKSLLSVIMILIASIVFSQQRVENYTLNRLQQAIDNCRDIDCWERNLDNNRPAGVTTEGLNELFDYVREVRNNNNPDRCD